MSRAVFVDRGTKWTVKRRYSEFRDLFEALSAKYEFPRSGSLFPGKFTVANALMPSHAGREQLARRRARKLELFLNEALACDVDSNLGAGLDVQPDRIPKTQCLREFVDPPLQLQLQSWRNAQNIEMTGNMFGVPPAGLLGSGGRPGGGRGGGSSSVGAAWGGAWSGASTPPPTARPPMSLLEQRLEVSSPREEQLAGVVLHLEEQGDQQHVDVGGGRGGDFQFTGLEQGPSSGSGARGPVAASSTRNNVAGEGSCSNSPTNSSPEMEEEEEVVAGGTTGSTATRNDSVAGPEKQHQHHQSAAANYSPGAGTSCLGSVCATTLCSTPLLGNTCIQDAEEAAKRLSTRSTVDEDELLSVGNNVNQESLSPTGRARNSRSNNAVLSNKPLGFRQTLSPAHELLNSFDVQLLSYVFRFSPFTRW